MNELTKRARELRQNQTNAEDIFWKRVKAHKTGYKVVRQKPLRFYIGKTLRFFIADFYCHKLHLVIELDGRIHENQKEYDEARDYIINQMRYTVIRIKNEEILNNLEEIIKSLFPLSSEIAAPEYLTPLPGA